MKRVLILLGVALMMAMPLALAQTAKDTLVEDEFGAIDTLDPAQAYDTSSGEVLDNVYETLYFYVGASNSKFEGRLATDYKISDDGLTYTYTLRNGVTFHNGDPMTCADVAYSVKRVMVTMNSAGPGWILMQPLTGYTADATTALKSDLGHAPTDADYHKLFQKIDNSVTCPDAHTVVFHLDHRDASFFNRLMYTVADVIDKKWAIANGQWDGTEATWKKWIGYDLHTDSYLQNHMNGTGPYQMVSWTPGQKFVAKAYPNYWGDQPHLKNVLINRDKEVSTRILNLQKGNADYIDYGSLSDIKQIQGSPGVKIWNVDGKEGWTSAYVGALFLNQKITTQNNSYLGSGKLDEKGIPPDFFADKDMRLCFTYAFDRDAFINQVDVGLGTNITMALPPSFLGYDPNIPKYTLDLEKAKQHCQAAFGGKAWQNGFKVTLFYNTGNTSRQTLEQIVKSNIEYLNPKFHVDVRGVAWPTYLKAMREYTMPGFAVAWLPDFADPADYIPYFYVPSPGNYADSIHFNNDQINQLNKQAEQETNPQARALIYNQIGQIAHQEEPFILYPQPRSIIIARTDLKGVYYNTMIGSGMYQWKDVYK